MRVWASEKARTLDTANEPARLAPDDMMSTYFDGDMERGFAMSGQVQGRIHAIEPVATILQRTWDECRQILGVVGRAAEETSSG